MKRIRDGALGDITAARCYWNQGSLWMKPREKDWSDMEWQIRNWLYFTWLSGDHICEQHVHNLDVVNWALDAHPVRAVGMGGREVRTSPDFGNIFDHFAIDYEYPERRPRHEHVPPDPRLREQRLRGRCRHQGTLVEPAPAGSRARPGGDSAVRKSTPTSRSTSTWSRASAPAAAQRTEDRRREHPDGHHGPDVGLHGQSRHLGGGAQLEAGLDAARARRSARCPSRRSLSPARPS